VVHTETISKKKSGHRDSGHGWIYLGTDKYFGQVYIYKDFSKLRVKLYDPGKKKQVFFTLESALGFIYLLRLDHLLIEAAYSEKFKKDPFLAEFIIKLIAMYKQLRRKVRRLRGIADVKEILQIRDSSLQVLYNQVLPLVKKRVGKLPKLRPLYSRKNPLKNQYWKRVQRSIRIIIDSRYHKKDAWQVYLRCLDIIEKLKEKGYIIVRSIDPYKFLSIRTREIPIDAEFAITKGNLNILFNKLIETIIRARIQQDPYLLTKFTEFVEKHYPLLFRKVQKLYEKRRKQKKRNYDPFDFYLYLLNVIWKKRPDILEAFAKYYVKELKVIEGDLIEKAINDYKKRKILVVVECELKRSAFLTSEDAIIRGITERLVNTDLEINKAGLKLKLVGAFIGVKVSSEKAIDVDVTEYVYDLGKFMTERGLQKVIAKIVRRVAESNIPINSEWYVTFVYAPENVADEFLKDREKLRKAIERWTIFKSIAEFRYVGGWNLVDIRRYLVIRYSIPRPIAFTQVTMFVKRTRVRVLIYIPKRGQLEIETSLVNPNRIRIISYKPPKTILQAIHHK